MAKGVTIPLNIAGLKQAKQDFADLKAEIKETSDVKLSQKLAKQINELGDAIDTTTDELLEMNKAGKLAGTRFDDLQETLFGVNEEILPLTSQIGEMEDRMYQLAAAGEAGNEEFVALQGETARLRRVIIETDKSVDLLAENSGLGVFASGWEEIGGSLARLDFAGAEKGADRLQDAMGNMTTIATKGMKSLAKTVGVLGKSFLKFGATLLLNPLFLLVAIVTAIIVGLVALRDKVAWIGAIFEFIAKPIRAIIQLFKDLLDWIGLTSFAEAEEQKKREAAWQERKAALAEEKRLRELAAAAKEREFNKEQGHLENQIKLYTAEGKNVDELTKQKIQGSIDFQKEQLKEIQTRFKNIKAMEIEAAKHVQSTNSILNSTAKAVQSTASETDTAVDEMKTTIESLEADLKIVDINAGKRAEERAAKKVEEHRKALEQIRKLEQDNILRMNSILDEIALAEEEFQTTQEQKELNKVSEKYFRLITLAEEFGQNTAVLKEAQLAEEQAIEDKYRQQEIEAEQKKADAIGAILLKSSQDKAKQDQKDKDDARKLAEGKANVAINGMQLVASVAELFANKSEKAAKIAFNVQKAASIAQAAMDGYKAVLSTYANTPGGVVLKGIAAGIAGSFSAIQIAKIAKSKFEGGGSGADVASSVPSGGLGGATSAPSTVPSFELFGQPNEGSEASSPESTEQTITVNAVVSEVEITETQNTINNIQLNAEL